MTHPDSSSSTPPATVCRLTPAALATAAMPPYPSDRASEVNQHYPDCPELNGLTVWPPERQSHGIGTAIIRAAQTLARQRGYHQIDLGVTDTNPRAAALYRRLGYTETNCSYLDRYLRRPIW